jgi:hypothetical protein
LKIGDGVTDQLIDVMDGYLGALTKHDPGLLAVADDVRVTENGYPVPLGRGLFETAEEVAYRHDIVDPAGDQITVFSVVREGVLPANVMVRLRVGGPAGGSVITEIETIVARKGQSSVARPDKLVTPDPVWARPVEATRRSDRATMIAIADSYFQAIEDDTAEVPFHPDCNRVENGQRTSNTGAFALSCRAQLERKVFSYITRIRDRRFVMVDEARGVVFAIVMFDVPGRKQDFAGFPVPVEDLPERMWIPRSLLLGELFKIDGGEIHAIEALMVNVPYGATPGWPG